MLDVSLISSYFLAKTNLCSLLFFILHVSIVKVTNRQTLHTKGLQSRSRD